MNPTRRSLCGLGIASVPLAMLGPKVLSAEQGAAAMPEPLLAYLVEDTRRNCGLTTRPGRERAQAFRSLGANVAVLTAYLQSRQSLAGVAGTVGQRVRDGGLDRLAHELGERWGAFVSDLARNYSARLPEHLDHPTATRAIENLQRWGFPRLGGLRRLLEKEADRIERSEGRAVATVFARQTPGNDYGPPGWSAGVGDGELSCWDLGVIIASLCLLMELFPELQPGLGATSGILGVVYAVACTS